LVLALSCPLAAVADERLVPLAQSGDWIAVSHKASITAPPDVCIAFNQRAGIAFRSDGNTFEFRVINDKWSLPASVEGSVVIVIGDWKLTLDISDNTDNSISADVEPAEVLTLLAAMDKASTMTVTAGKAKPIVASLTGSSKVANAFRTCAGIEGSSGKGGENPFK
jgi:hypothetical protein